MRPDTIFTLPPGKRQKGKKANLLNVRPPDMRPDTIFTPPREKGKFTQSETPRYETIYYFYPPLPPGKKAKREKDKFTQYETSRYETRYY